MADKPTTADGCKSEHVALVRATCLYVATKLEADLAERHDQVFERVSDPVERASMLEQQLSRAWRVSLLRAVRLCYP